MENGLEDSHLPVCESSVIKYDGEEAECPHCGEIIREQSQRS